MRGENSWKSLCHWKMISLSKTKRKLVKMLTYRETCLQWTPLIYKMNTLHYWTHWCQTVSHCSPHPYFLCNMNLIHVCVSGAHSGAHWMGLTVLIFYTSRVERDSRMQGCHLGAEDRAFPQLLWSWPLHTFIGIKRKTEPKTFLDVQLLA